MRGLASEGDVVALAPATIENREVTDDGHLPGEVVLLPGLGHWRDSELQRGLIDKLGDELLRGALRFDSARDELLGRADVVDIQWPRALPQRRYDGLRRRPGRLLRASPLRRGAGPGRGGIAVQGPPGQLAPEWVEQEFSFEGSIDLVLDVHARRLARRRCTELRDSARATPTPAITVQFGLS